MSNVSVFFGGWAIQVRLYASLRHLINMHLGDEVFSACFGSVGRGEDGYMSDIDLLVVLRQSPAPSDRIEFECRFIDFQRKLGYLPDEDFPAEIVDVNQMKAAIAWFGVQVEQGHPILDPIDRNGWTSENEYRQWLCAAAGPNTFVSGDRNKYERTVRVALASTALLALTATSTAKVTKGHLADILVGLGKEGLGFCDTHGTRTFLDTHLTSALTLLSDVSALRYVNDGYIVSSDVMHRGLPSLLAGRFSL